MNSKHTLEEKSYNAILQIIGSVSTILQTEDLTNNRGFGYNYIEDSTFETFILNNGNFKNCNLINPTENKISSDIFYKSTEPFRNIINGGKYELCDISNLRSSGGYFLNSSLTNCNLYKSKVVSSEAIDTMIDQGYWSSEGGIQVKGAELWSYDYNEGSLLGSTYSDIRGTIKIFISEQDFYKLKKGDAFYISKLNKNIISDLLSDDQKIELPLENRFLIDNYYDYTLDVGKKKPLHISLKSSNENQNKFSVISSNNPILTYEEVLDGDNLDYWYKIPSFSNNSSTASYRGEYKYNYDITTRYYLGDFIYELDSVDPNITNFYLYWPIDRFTNERAKNQSEALQYAIVGQGTPENNGFTDWIFVGTYSGIWATSSVYEGYYSEEVILPYSPRYPLGNIIGDNSDVSQANNFWIFVGTGDGIIPITNKTKLNLVKSDYVSENFATSSNFDLPSIDITSDLFGYYYDKDDIINYTSNYKLSPIEPNNINDVFVNNILTNADLRSGLFNNSIWLSGDNSNLTINEFVPTNFTNLMGRSVPNNYNIKLDIYNSKKVLIISRNNKILSDFTLSGYDYEIDDIIWIKSLDYVYNNTTYNVDGRYKVVNLTKTDIYVESDEVVNPIENLPLSLSVGKFSTSLAKYNKYFSFHKVFFKNSKIVGGKFYRTSFENCTFENDNFQKYIYPSKNITNTEIIRIINVLFSRSNNIVSSGVVYKSHLVGETFNGATFYESIWMNGTFNDGLFKSSVWIDGSFNGGKFVDNKSPLRSTFDFDYSSDFKIWQNGTFNGGEFYNSLWVRGTFNNGRFYKSDWTGGIWNNGILGSKNLRANETTLGYYGPSMSFGATFTYWYDGIVENAILGGDGALDWFGGRILSGQFTSNGRSQTKYSTWHGGEFYGSSFTGQAWWKAGKFFSGKFLSEIGWNLVTFTTYSNNITDYGWVSGEFYSGEFGFGNSIGTNSTWYDGVFYNGTFIGKFWRNGIMLDGNFYGNFVNSGEISENLLNYKTDFYGLWNDGSVNNVLYNVKNDVIVKNDVSSNRRKRNTQRIPNPSLSNIIWKSGTFSHQNGSFNDSVWINGNFNSGNFNNSIFNPFIDLNLSTFGISDYQKKIYLTILYNTITDSIINNPLGIIPQIDSILLTIDEFNNNQKFNLNLSVDYDQLSGFATITDFNSLSYGTSLYNINPQQNSTTTVMRIRDVSLFDKDNDEFIAVVFYVQFPSSFTTDTYLKNLTNVTNLPFKFEERDTCVWTGGNFNGGEFNYSKWLDGNFNDGTMSGAIWFNGTFNYGFMYNCYWEDGIWRNGNWFGANFDQNSLEYDGINGFFINDKRTSDIIENLYNYDQTSTDVFLSDVVILTDLETSVHNYNPSIGFFSWTYSVDE
jgi:hypothetical protein